MSRDNLEASPITNYETEQLRSVEEIGDELAIVRQEKGRLMQLRQTPMSAENGKADQINDDWKKIEIVEQLLEEELSEAKDRRQALIDLLEGKAANDDSDQTSFAQEPQDRERKSA